MKKWDMECDKNDGLTVGTRNSQLNRIFFMAKAIPKDFKDMTRGDIQDYIYNLKLAPGTISLVKVYIKKFFKWLNGNETYPDAVKWIKVKNHKKRTLHSDILTPGEVLSMIDAADNPRDRALVSITHESGGRVGEILGLKQKDVEPDQYGVIINITGKTGPRRVRLIDTAPDLTLWLNNHPYKGRDMPVFYSSRNPSKAITGAAVQWIFKKLAKKAGIEKRVYPHLFRHTRATRLAGKMTDAELKKFLGWTPDSQMVGTYVSLSDGDIHKKILEINGIITKQEAEKESDVLKARTCPRCKENNPSTARFCYKCGMALDMETAAKVENEGAGMTLELLDLMKREPRILDLLKQFSDASAKG